MLDAGSTETGRPYFVMEYIKGIPILEYCDREKLDTRARLERFTNVCHAIQHAHQKEIIHRDIKPSNVLVARHDGVPVPKVIDFCRAHGGREGFEPATFSLGTASGDSVVVRACSGTTGQVRDVQGDVADDDDCWIW